MAARVELWPWGAGKSLGRELERYKLYLEMRDLGRALFTSAFLPVTSRELQRLGRKACCSLSFRKLGVRQTDHLSLHIPGQRVNPERNSGGRPEASSPPIFQWSQLSFQRATHDQRVFSVSLTSALGVSPRVRDHPQDGPDSSGPR